MTGTFSLQMHCLPTYNCKPCPINSPSKTPQKHFCLTGLVHTQPYWSYTHLSNAASNITATLHLCAYNHHNGELLLRAFASPTSREQVRLMCYCFGSIYSVKLNTLIHSMLDPISITWLLLAWLSGAVLGYISLFLPLPVIYNERFR